MYNFAPENYQSPFDLLSRGIVNEHVESRESDIVYSDDLVMALICSWQFVGSSHEGHTLVVPREHHENIFDLPLELGHRIHEVCRLVSIATLRAYNCDGITIWQNNGPAATQTVWHYHTHVIPRTNDDNYFELLLNLDNSFRFMPEEERTKYADRLRNQLESDLQADTN